MSYFTLLFKKVSRKWLNVIPIILMMIFVVIVYLGSLRSMSYIMDIHKEEQQIEGFKNDIEIFKEDLQSYEPTSKAYKNTQYNIDIATQTSTLRQSRLNAYKNGNWNAYYDSDQELTKLDLKITMADKNVHDTQSINVLNMYQKYAQYMKNHDMKYDQLFVPIQGFSYMARVMNDYLPLILAIIIVFIASIMYCSSFYDKKDIHRLVPLSRLRKQSSKLLVGVSYGILTFMFFIALPIACGGIGTTVGNLQTPILTYPLNEATQFVSLASVLPQVLLMTLLVICFLVNLVSIVSLLTKKTLVCLMVSLAIILATIWMATSIVPLYPLLHLLPTTYISSLKVITQEMMHGVNNANVNFMNGIIVLGVSNVVLFACYHYGSKVSLMRER